MSTKNNPGQYDCLAKAEPDEPYFVLLGRDPLATFLVAIWCDIKRELGEDEAKIAEARECALAMADWPVLTCGKKEEAAKIMKIVVERYMRFK